MCKLKNDEAGSKYINADNYLQFTSSVVLIKNVF